MQLVEIGGTRINKFTTSLGTMAALPNPEIVIGPGDEARAVYAGSFT